MDNDERAAYYASQLSLSGRAWLNARGIQDETIRRFRLGEVVRPVAGDERFQGCVSIPYILPTESVRSLRYRVLRSQAHQKYDAPTGVGTHIFNVGATAQDSVVICEGEFDAIILAQLGLSAVGIPGANGFKPEWRYLFTTCEAVTLAFDGDEAGQKGANRIASILGNTVDNLSIRKLPAGKDITDLYLENKEALRELLA